MKNLQGGQKSVTTEEIRTIKESLDSYHQDKRYLQGTLGTGQTSHITGSRMVKHKLIWNSSSLRRKKIPWVDKDEAVWEAVSQDLFLVLSHPGALEAAVAKVSEPLLLQLQQSLHFQVILG